MSFAEDQALKARRERSMGAAYRLFYDRPLHLVRGEGATVWDSEGRAYLDAYNNVPSVGHCHPRVVAALTKQAATLNTHTRYLHENVVQYAERLTALFPPELSQVILTCTGSEANDLALRVARMVTGHRGVIVTENAYHGVTAALAEMSPSLGTNNPIGSHVRLVAAPDSYRLGAEGARVAFGKSVRDAIASLQRDGHGVAVMICDTVFASDGIFIDPSAVLNEAVTSVRAAGGLFIADEVQSGLARPGSNMWAFQRYGVVPDLVTLGKPLGDGHPLAALVARPQYLDVFGKATRYFNTFGGNPVAAAVGLAVLDVIEEENLMANASHAGKVILDGLRDIVSRHSSAGDARGAGLYAALELVEDPELKTPATARAMAVVNRLRDDGFLVGSCGKAGNCLKIRPPLCFTSLDAERLLHAIENALVAFSA